MELTEINLEEVNDARELIDIADHAQKVMDKVDEATAAYGAFEAFPYFHAEMKEDGLIHLSLSADPEEPVITISPGDWNNTVKHLRDTYFPGVKAFAESLRNAVIAKTNGILNP